MTSSSVTLATIVPLLSFLTINDLCDDVLLEIFRRLPLQDLIRIELVCHRWKVFQDRVLREKTRLVLLDKATYSKDPIKKLAAVPPCSHLTCGNLCNDILFVRTLYQLVSFLYYVAPRLPNIRVLYISIHNIVPEQLAQVLLKFHHVECLTLYGKPTQNATEWISVQKALTYQYTKLRHFSSNYHLAPEKKFDPLFEAAISQLDASAFWLGEKVFRVVHFILNPDGFLKYLIGGLFHKLFPSRKTIGADRNPQNEEDDQANVQIPPPDPHALLPTLFSRVQNQVVAWMALIFGWFRKLYDKVHSSTSELQDEMYWHYLSRLEELHIPGHFNRIYKQSYTFSPSIGSTGSLKRLTIGDTKVLHSCNAQLFQSLGFLYITDVWDRNYAYLYEKLAQCVNLSELRIHFIHPLEESTLDMLDFLEEGCVKHTNAQGFQHLNTLVLDFPVASLSRRYYLKFRSIFPSVTSVALNFSRINTDRRAKLIRYMESNKIGFPRLDTLHVLSNGTCYNYLGWLEGSRKLRTFNLSYLKQLDVKQLKVFLTVARARAAAFRKGSLEDQLIRLELSNAQYAKIRVLHSRMLAQSFGVTTETNIRVIVARQPRGLALVHDLSQHGIETI